MKVADYARAVKAVEAEFDDDWGTIEDLMVYGAPVDAVVNAVYMALTARRRAVWGIACLYLQATARRHGVTAPLPKFGMISRSVVKDMVREHYRGEPATPANIRGVKQKAVSNIRDVGRGVIASSASTKFQEYEDKRGTAPEPPKDTTPVEKGETVTREATEEEIDEILARYWDAEDLASRYVERDKRPGVKADDKVRKPVGWARVIQGAETCGFCIVMAARAYDYILYKSEATALRRAKGQAKGGYHPNCDCIAVPVFDVRKWEGKAQAQRAREWYDQHNDKDESWRSMRGTV